MEELRAFQVSFGPMGLSGLPKAAGVGGVVLEAGQDPNAPRTFTRGKASVNGERVLLVMDGPMAVRLTLRNTGSTAAEFLLPWDTERTFRADVVGPVRFADPADGERLRSASGSRVTRTVRVEGVTAPRTRFGDLVYRPLPPRSPGAIERRPKKLDLAPGESADCWLDVSALCDMSLRGVYAVTVRCPLPSIAEDKGKGRAEDYWDAARRGGLICDGAAERWGAPEAVSAPLFLENGRDYCTGWQWS